MGRSIPLKSLPIEYNPQLSGYTIYEDGLHTYIITLKSLTEFLSKGIVSGVTEELNIEISNRISGDTFLFSLITGETENRISGDTYLQINKFDVTGGTIYGNILIGSGYTITGDGSGLFNIPASGVTGLELDRITSGSYSAVISNSGFTVNTNTYVSGDTLINGNLIITDKTTLNYVVDSNGFTGNTNDTIISTTTGITWVDTSSTVNLKNEFPTGIIDGINKFFTTSQPYVSGSLMLFRNGIKDSHFGEISDTQIEIETPPSNTGFTDVIEVTYIIK